MDVVLAGSGYVGQDLSIENKSSSSDILGCLRIFTQIIEDIRKENHHLGIIRSKMRRCPKAPQDDEIELAGLNDPPGALPNPQGVRWEGENDSNAGRSGSRTALTRTKRGEGIRSSGPCMLTQVMVNGSMGSAGNGERSSCDCHWTAKDTRLFPTRSESRFRSKTAEKVDADFFFILTNSY